MDVTIVPLCLSSCACCVSKGIKGGKLQIKSPSEKLVRMSWTDGTVNFEATAIQNVEEHWVPESLGLAACTLPSVFAGPSPVGRGRLPRVVGYPDPEMSSVTSKIRVCLARSHVLDSQVTSE